MQGKAPNPQPLKAYYTYVVGDAGEANAAGDILMVDQGRIFSLTFENP